MAAAHALFPGTFDPPTLGHLDLVARASRMFERVTVALAEHPAKVPSLSFADRQRLLEECTQHLSGVSIVRLEGLVVDAAARLGCDVLVRGVRCGTDFDYESQMAGTNRALAPDLDTVLLSTAPELSHITGTLVRQVAAMGGDTSALVPDPVARALSAKRG